MHWATIISFRKNDQDADLLYTECVLQRRTLDVCECFQAGLGQGEAAGVHLLCTECVLRRRTHLCTDPKLYNLQRNDQDADPLSTKCVLRHRTQDV